MCERHCIMAARTSVQVSTVQKGEPCRAEQLSGTNGSALTWNCVTFHAWCGSALCCIPREIVAPSLREGAADCRRAERLLKARGERWSHFCIALLLMSDTHCLPIGIYRWLGEGGCIEAVFKVVCCMEVRPGLSGKKMRWYFSEQRLEWSDGCVMLRAGKWQSSK